MKGPYGGVTRSKVNRWPRPPNYIEVKVGEETILAKAFATTWAVAGLRYRRLDECWKTLAERLGEVRAKQTRGAATGYEGND